MKIINVDLKLNLFSHTWPDKKQSISINCDRYTGKSKSKEGLIKNILSKILGYAKHLLYSVYLVVF